MSKYYKFALIGTAIVCAGIIGIALFGGGSSSTTDESAEVPVLTEPEIAHASGSPTSPTPPVATTTPSDTTTVPSAPTPGSAATVGPANPAPSQPGVQDRGLEQLLPPSRSTYTEVTVIPVTPTNPSAGTTASKTYVVKAGDTLSSIAQREYGNQSRWVEIARANPTVDPNRLHVGQSIRLPATSGSIAPVVSHTPTALAATPPAKRTATNSSGQHVHMVRSGDTLYSIARQYYRDADKWSLIYSANRKVIGANPDRLPEGARLHIPSTDLVLAR